MRIAFFMKRASRTGSEIVLCNFIRYGVANGLEALVACEKGGEVLSQLPAGVPAVVYEDWQSMQRTYAGAMRRLRGDRNGFTSYIEAKYKPDLWYVNTIIQPHIVLEAQRKKVKCVLHSHELEHMLAQLTEAETTALVRYPQLILTGSQAALEVLRRLGRHSDIHVSYDNIDAERINFDNETTRKLRRGLGISDETFVWAMSGTMDPNKNPARFVSVGIELLRRGHDVHFIWLGGLDSGYSLYVKEMVRNSGCADRITFLGHLTDDCYDWLNVAQGVILTSFKDCFPLVMIEAAYLGKPIVSFNSGGVKEFVRDGVGVVVDSWNDCDLINAMLKVMNREIPFDAAVAKSRAAEFSIAVQGKRWLALLTDYFAG